MVVFGHFRRILKVVLLTFMLCISSAFAVECVAPWVPNEANTECVCDGLLYDDSGDGVYSADECHEAYFKVDTVALSAKDYVAFRLAAKGTFYVDWGDNSGVEPISPTDTSIRIYSHTYETAGSYTIKFSSKNIKAYSAVTNPSIQFGFSSTSTTNRASANNNGLNVKASVWRTKIKKAYGSLNRLLPILGNGTSDDQIPTFYYTFGYCNYLSTIGENLFGGYDKTRSDMFAYTFAYSGLTTLPNNLFPHISAADKEFLFYYAFYNNSGLTGYIPATLFKNMSTTPYGDDAMDSMFANSALSTSCSNGTRQYVTGFEKYWNDKVSCIPDNKIVCPVGYWGATDSNDGVYKCTPCSDNDNCPTVSNLYECPDGYIGDNKSYTCVPRVTYNVAYHNVDFPGETIDMTGAVAQYVNTTAMSLPVPTREHGYIFSGWYDNPNFTGEVIKSLNAGYYVAGADTIHLYAKWSQPVFFVKTTNISAGDYVAFRLATQGTFYVDWGDGKDEIITNPDTTQRVYSHTYDEGADEYLIQIASGIIDAYNTNAGSSSPSIQFGFNSTSSSSYASANNNGLTVWSNVWPGKIKEIYGSLSELLPILGNGASNDQIPNFYYAFRYCSALTSIGDNLFGGYDKTRPYMFYYTFGNTGLTTLPNNLFPNMSAVDKSYALYYMFSSDSGLTGYIPATLFRNMNTTPYGDYAMGSIFSGTDLATSCPEDSNIKQYVTGFEEYWDNKVSCIPINKIVCPVGEWGPTDSNNLTKCTSCSGNANCPTVSNLYECPDGYIGDTQSYTCVPVETYSITYHNVDFAGETVNMNGAPTQHLNTNPTTLTVPTREHGHMFRGWYDNPDFTGEAIKTLDIGYHNNSGNIDLYAKWVEPSFFVKTTDIPANSYVAFRLAAQGTFYVDWGDGTDEIIPNPGTTSDTTQRVYSHTYEEAAPEGGYTIRFASGIIDAYNTSNSIPTIQFGFESTSSSSYLSANNNGLRVYANAWPGRIKEAYGSLSDLFPVLGNGSKSNQIPSFYYAFRYCNALTNIGDNLFGGYDKTRPYMFYYTFGNTGLTTLPNNLFPNISAADKDSLFYYAFYNNSGLTGYIPATLFRNMSTTPYGTNAMASMFASTGLAETCPEEDNLKQYVTGFESYWDNKVSCIPIDEIVCPVGYWGATDSNDGVYKCTSCSSNANCPIVSNLYECPDGYIGDTQSYKCDIPITTYDITYHNVEFANETVNMNGGPTQHLNTTTTLLTQPTRTGWLFGGWYDNSDLTGAPVTSFGIGYTNNETTIHLYAKWLKPALFVTTTNIAANNYIVFRLGTQGTFYVDWGDNSGVEIIASPDVTNRAYSHTYQAAAPDGGYTIRLASDNIVAYTTSTDINSPAIQFGYYTNSSQNTTSANNNGLSVNPSVWRARIKEVYGSLSDLLPILGNGSKDEQIPGFQNAFGYCEALTSIGESLLDGYNKTRYRMFYNTFRNSGLTTLPNNLFTNMPYVDSEQALNSMFSSNSNLTGYIPATLFRNMRTTPYGTNAMDYIFSSTGLAKSCTGKTKQYVTGFESYWTNKVSCIPSNQIVCPVGEWGATDSNDGVYKCMSCSGNDNCPTVSNLYECPEDYISDAQAYTCMPAVRYTITYHDGDVTTSETYKNDEVHTFQNPSKQDKLFAGWYRNEDFTGDAVTSIEAGYTGGDIDLYAKRVAPTFFVKTTDTISANEYVAFNLAVKGNIYVDWGDESDDEIIISPDVTNRTYSHTYREAAPEGGYVIRFASDNITGYNTITSSSQNYPAIQFGYYSSSNVTSTNNNNLTVSPSLWKARIKEIYGSLSDLFPIVGAGTSVGQIPTFYYAFRYCNNLTSIADNLFSGYNKTRIRMFFYTFANTGLTTLPNNLFPKITAPNQNYMFEYMFYSNNGLTEYIPATLFRNMSATPYGTDAMYYIFGSTNLMTSCPEGTKQYVTGLESYWTSKVSCIPVNNIVCPVGYWGATDSNDVYKCTACSGTDNCPTDSNLYECPNGYIGDAQSYTCIPAGTYDIVYHNVEFEGETIDMTEAPLEYTNDKSTKLPKLVRDGYKFVGWYGNENFTGDVIEVISAGTVGELHLWAKWVPAVFFVRTTSMLENSYAAFMFSAKGKLYVDWGDGSAVETITSNDTSEKVYSHTYKKAKSEGYVISFDVSDITAYNTGSVPVIRFGSPSETSTSTYSSSNNNGLSVRTGVWRTKVGEIWGSLSAVFPVLGDGSTVSQVPSFYESFKYCTGLTKIGENVFAGYDKTRDSMFTSAFAYTKLTTLPNNLFPNISAANKSYLFTSMFYGETNPSYASYASNLTGYIPPTLFRNMSATPYGSDAMYYMFAGTKLAETCPDEDNLKQYMTGFEDYWSNKVSCIPINKIVCPVGEWGATDSNDGVYKCMSCSGNDNCPTDSNLYECPEGYIGDTQSYTCVPIVTYMITYHNVEFAGETIDMTDAPTQHKNTSNTLLTRPIRHGYIFMGWYDNPDFTGQTITSFDINYNNGDIDLYAKWVKGDFFVKTTNISAGDYVAFRLAFNGSLYIDWGDGSALETITRSSTSNLSSYITNSVYSHTYDKTSEDGYVITFKKVSIALYHDDYYGGKRYPVIQFGTDSSTAENVTSVNNNSLVVNSGVWPTRVKKIYGSLSDLFPILGSYNDQIPIFQYAFRYCNNLTEISENLFGGYNRTKPYMFYYTFSGTGLTALPNNLFPKISTISSGNLFTSMFYADSNLTGYIPATLFRNMNANDSNTISYLKYNYAMSSIFYNTGLAETCPDETKQYVTGFESYWNNKVSCIPIDEIVCPVGEWAATGSNDVYKCRSCSGNTNCPTVSNLYQCPEGYIGDVESYTCIPLVTYTITYHDGDETTTRTYTNDTKVVLSNPSKKNELFMGWYDNDGDIKTYFDIGYAGGNIDLYAKWAEPSFFVKTTSVSANEYVAFNLAVNGTVSVDWGDGTDDELIISSDTTQRTYSHTYTQASPEGGYIIRFASDNINGYDASDGSSTIQFGYYTDSSRNLTSANNNGLRVDPSVWITRIKEIYGSLSDLFPVLGNGSSDSQIPSFYEICDYCNNLTKVGENLFGGYNKTRSHMFASAFASSGLPTLPHNLFPDVPDVSTDFVVNTLFGFNSNLTGYIPATLFANMTYNPNNYGNSAMYRIFLNDSGLIESCPAEDNIKQYVTGFESYWDNKVACIPLESDLCKGGYKLNLNTLECEACSGDGCPQYAKIWCYNGALYDEETRSCPMIAVHNTITYNTDGGVLASDDNIVQDENNTSVYTQEYYETESINVSAPTRNGYNFTGWCVYNSAENTGAGCSSNNRQLTVTISEGSAVDVWLYATWSPIEYTITYTTNGGTLSGNGIVQDNENSNLYTQTYTVADNIALSRPTKSGYIFGGWCPESVIGNEVPCLVDTISSIESDTGNKSLYATWFEDKFQVITSAVGYKEATGQDDEFCFDIYAAGNFVIDWDDNGATTYKSYASVDHGDDTEICHTYSGNARARTIRIGGLATGYDNESMKDTHSISFYDNQYITQLTGSLGAIFPTIWDANHENIEQQPNFTSTFESCTNLTTIPGELFGRTVGNEYQGISGSGEGLFYFTFAGSGITHIPSNLFAGVSGAADAMFSYTFSGCDGLGTDPNYPNPIPENLFAGVSGTAEQMFNETFSFCTGLTELPNSLFPNITAAPAEQMFRQTFANCSNLNGYVPYTLFANMSDVNYASDAMEDTFMGTNLSTDAAQCPSGTTVYTGWDNTFRQDWTTDYENPDAKAISCIPVYNIIYHNVEFSGETVVNNNPSTFTELDAITLTNPTRDGYIFNNWCSVNAAECPNANIVTSITAGTNQNVDLYATWTPMLTIHYNNIDGAVNNNPEHFMPGETVALADPTKDGFVFLGWCRYSDGNWNDGPNCGRYSYVHNIENYNSDAYLYAVWVENTTQSCSAGEYAFWRVYGNNDVSYHCYDCPIGYYCPNAGEYSLSDAMPILDESVTGGNPDYGAGLFACSGEHEYSSDTGATSCSICDRDVYTNEYGANTLCKCFDGYIYNKDTKQCVSYNQISCPVRYETARFASFVDYDSVDDKYLSFECEGCFPGFACDGGIYDYNSMDTIDSNGWGSYVGVGAAQCSGEYQYSDWYATSCSTCPDGILPNDAHRACVCGEGEFWYSNNKGTEHSCQSVDSATVEPGEYVYFRNTDWTTEDCRGGYYCPGGTYTRTEADEYGYAGRFACDENEYSLRNATSCTACPTAESHGTGTLINQTNYSAECGCEDGYTWNLYAGACVPNVVCPADTNNYVNGGQFISMAGEAFADVNNDGTIDVDDCVTMYWFGKAWDVMRSESQEEFDMYVQYLSKTNYYDSTKDMNTDISVDFVACKYDSESGKYNKDCSNPLYWCDRSDLESQMTSDEQLFFVSGMLSGLIDMTNSNWPNAVFQSNQTLADLFIPENNRCVMSCALGYEYNPINGMNSSNACDLKSYQCDAGEYLKLDTENHTLSVESCEENNYCTGGTWTVNDVDSTTNAAGMTACVAGSTSIAGSSTCTCGPGYTWNATNNTCNEIVCPATPQSDEWSPTAQSYGSSINECVAAVSYDDEAFAFFKYNPDTEQYDAAYTPAYKVCDDDDLTQILTVWTNDGLVALLQYMSGEEDVSNLGGLFTDVESGQSAPEMPEVYDRCCPDGWVCCGAGTYIDFDAIGTDDQCPNCPAGSYCEGKQWNPETEFDSGEEKCLAGTYSSVEGATSADTCLPCPTDYPLSADGTTDIAQCYANCPTNPVCVDNGSSCAYVNANQTTKTFGNVCGTNVTSCNGGYTPTSAAGWLSVNQDKMIPLSVCHLNSTTDCSETVTFSDLTQETITLRPGQFAVALDEAPMSNARGYASCNETVGNNSSVAARINANGNFVPTTTGANCWIKLTQIGAMEINTPWVYVTEYTDNAECEHFCGMIMNSSNPYPYSEPVLAALMMSAAQNQINVCEANTVNIAWDGIAEPDNLGMCTYGKNLTTPQDEPTQENRLFLGWKPVLITNNENNLENNENFTGNGE